MRVFFLKYFIMDGKIFDIDRLSKDELAYELRVRSCPEQTTVVRMRHTLRQFIRLEREGSVLVDFEACELPLDDELGNIEDKIRQVKNLIAEFPTHSSEGNFRKLQTKLFHVKGRVDRIPYKTASIKQRREMFLRDIVALGCEMLDVCKPLVADPDGETPADVDTLAKQIPDTCKITDHDSRVGQETATSSGPLDETTNISLTPQHLGKAAAKFSRNRRSSGLDMKPVPLSKWNVKFSGEKDSLSVSAFLERIQELCLSRNFPEEFLLDQAIDLFTGPALIWFRSIRDSVATWDELVTLLRREFQPYDYEYRLLEECRRRTQGRDETLGIFVAVMKNLFNRLTEPPSDEEKLRMIIRNLNPFYQQGLGYTQVDTLEQLLTIGRRLEDRRSAAESYVSPRPQKGDLETDLSYIGTATSKSPSQPTCFFCKKPGHFRRECPSRRKTSQAKPTTRTEPKNE